MAEIIRAGLLVAILALAACSPEARLRRTLSSQITGVIHLPSGTIEVSSELDLAPQAHDLEIVGSNTLLKASNHFRGRAIFVADGARRIRFRDFGVDGNRGVIARPLQMALPENAFRVWYPNNGILFDRSEGLEVTNLRFANVVNFPILVSRSRDIKISQVTVEDSGSRNDLGRNNLSGGILIEEGSSDFAVRQSVFRRISGNALWTHSMFIAPREQDGMFADNSFDTIGRDAIQVGHATHVRVEGNVGSNIGYPVELVDVENDGVPVAIDTSGDVDASFYTRNHFEEVNGACIDLDGFHDGAVRDNVCINRREIDAYPFGRFAIVMNNTYPRSQSENVEITGNLIDGMKFGGLFLMGRGHRVVANQFLNLNRAGCNESLPRVHCIYRLDEPEMLETGIYFGRGARPGETRGNVVRGNRITGHKMSQRCFHAGPGVSLAPNTIERNECAD